jgi:hypothetical protein
VVSPATVEREKGNKVNNGAKEEGIGEIYSKTKPTPHPSSIG